jgi:hypothetical protein
LQAQSFRRAHSERDPDLVTASVPSPHAPVHISKQEHSGEKEEHPWVVEQHLPRGIRCRPDAVEKALNDELPEIDVHDRIVRATPDKASLGNVI